MNRHDKRPFVQWFVLLLCYITIAFFAMKLGVFTFIWFHDFTYTTSIIGGIFAIMMLFLGVAAWNVDKKPHKANALTIVASRQAYICTLFGLLGTAVGLMYQLENVSHVNVTEMSNVISLIGNVCLSLSSALLSTAVGIIAAIGITEMSSNIEYFLDVKDVETAE